MALVALARAFYLYSLSLSLFLSLSLSLSLSSSLSGLGLFRSWLGVFDGKRNNGNGECRTERIYAGNRREIDACPRFLLLVFRLCPGWLIGPRLGLLIDIVNFKFSEFRHWDSCLSSCFGIKEDRRHSDAAFWSFLFVMKVAIARTMRVESWEPDYEVLHAYTP